VIARSHELPPATHVLLVTIACVGFVVMLAAEPRGGGLGLALVASSMGALAVVALTQPAHFTGDLWSYAMYGRMLAAHHASPYTHVPADFPLDPFVLRVGRGWRHTPSVYGPAFSIASAGVALVAGTAQATTRVLYQLLAVAALGGASAIVWRRTRSAAAVAFLGLNPVVVLFVMSGARNDILVGLAAVGAVVLTERDRPAAAGVAGALGALVKVTGVVALAAIWCTQVGRADPGRLRRFMIAAGTTMLAGYALFGPAALFTPMGTAGALYSRGSVWDLLPQLGDRLPAPHVALAVLAVLVAVVLARHARGDAGTAVAGSLTMLSLGASWALPGYAVWGMPAAALDHRSTVARISAAGGIVLLLTYEVLRHPIPGGAPLHDAVRLAGPAALGLLAVALLCTHTRRAPRRDLMPLHPITDASPAPTPTLVVMPTLNERPNIETALLRVRRTVPDADVLVVDDGSTDGTVQAAEAAALRLDRIWVVPRSGPRGLGPAYRFGFGIGLAAGYQTLVEMDADLSHDARDLPALLEAVRNGADLAVGSRYVDGGMTVGWPAHRLALSRAGGWYARRMLRVPVRDVTSGYRAYRADLLRAIDVETVASTGYGFQIEMTHRAARSGARITEVPIVFRERQAGSSKMSMRIVAEALAMITRTAFRSEGAPPDVHRDGVEVRPLAPAAAPSWKGRATA